jgi:hypothetical protein
VLTIKAIGHSSLRGTIHYYHWLPEHLRALVDDPDLTAGRVGSIRAAR